MNCICLCCLFFFFLVPLLSSLGHYFVLPLYDRWEDSGWRVQDADIIGRRDLRGAGLNTMSVDPPGCQDIDDAMHVRRKGNGKLEVRKCCSVTNPTMSASFPCVFSVR